ncbi:MAG: GTPase [Bacteroidales bacterium]
MLNFIKGKISRKGFIIMNIYEAAKSIRNKLSEEQKNPLKIALFGQPGSGKSSIINKLVGVNVVKTGVSTDKTVEAEIVSWNDLLLVDLPGYGTTKFPANEFFDKFNVDNFDLYLCVYSGKLHEADTNFFRELSSNGKICIFTRNFLDTIWQEGIELDFLKKEIIEDTRKQIGSEVNVYFTSCRTGEGLKELSEAIYNNLNEAQKAKWLRSAKAYSLEFLDKKRDESKEHISFAAGAALTNSINPLPGVDIGIDVAILLDLFASIRRTFGLTDQRLHSMDVAVPVLAPVVNNILKYSTKEGILILLKRFIGLEFVKSVAKYIPFVGQVIAATIAYKITSSAGMSYLEDCYNAAKTILEEELKNKKN